MKCCSPMVGCMIFASLYVLSGVTMASTGIITMIRMPVVFKTGSVIWSGIMATGMGILTMLIVIFRRSADIRKNASLLVLSVVVLITCSINLILFEIVEWREIFGPKMEMVDPQMGDTDGVFLAHLICLVSTVVGLVSSFVGSIFICCMIDPERGIAKTMNNVAGDPEMYKHKYLSTSPPYFSNPSPSGLDRSIQGTGRLDSWTFQAPPAPRLGRLVEEDEFMDEEPDTVVRIESDWATRERSNVGQFQAEPGERASLLGRPVIVIVPPQEAADEGPIMVTVSPGPSEEDEGSIVEQNKGSIVMQKEELNKVLVPEGQLEQSSLTVNQNEIPCEKKKESFAENNEGSIISENEKLDVVTVPQGPLEQEEDQSAVVAEPQMGVEGEEKGHHPPVMRKPPRHPKQEERGPVELVVPQRGSVQTDMVPTVEGAQEPGQEGKGSTATVSPQVEQGMMGEVPMVPKLQQKPEKRDRGSFVTGSQEELGDTSDVVSTLPQLEAGNKNLLITRAQVEREKGVEGGLVTGSRKKSENGNELAVTVPLPQLGDKGPLMTTPNVDQGKEGSCSVVRRPQSVSKEVLEEYVMVAVPEDGHEMLSREPMPASGHEGVDQGSEVGTISQKVLGQGDGREQQEEEPKMMTPAPRGQEDETNELVVEVEHQVGPEQEEVGSKGKGELMVEPMVEPMVEYNGWEIISTRL